jgi:hypothetical protein
MDDSAATEKFKYHWYNPATGKVYDPKTIQGKKILQFYCPESYPGVPDYRDWVLYICKE